MQKIKGTQDFLDLTLINFITEQTTKQLLLNNFSQIDLPALEPVELFKRTVGEETDIVSKEMFTIAPRAGSSELICLRPEATAQTMRAFLENGIQQLPWKVFSFGAMFRYERPQKGRYRQFHQCNIEVIGTDSIDQDVWLISILDHLFSQNLQLKNYALTLNFLGCKDDRISFRNQLKSFLQSKDDICETCQRRAETNPLRIFDCKNPDCQTIYQQAPKITDYLCDNCQNEWETLKSHLELLGVSFAVNPRLVRGLDYYNQTVFEFASTDLGAQSAFCGGGRYELATQLGHKTAIPAIGAAFGMERLALILESKQDQLMVPKKPALVAIIPLANEQIMLSLMIAQSLGRQQICTDLVLDGESIKSKMRKANKLGAAYCILVGENEQAGQTATIKDMLTGNEETISQAQVAVYLKSKGI